MANLPFRQYKLRIANGDQTGFDTIDIRAMIVMTNSTFVADEAAGAVFESDIATLDEYDGTSYARQTLGATTVALNGANAEVDVADFTFPTLGAGTRQGMALILYEHGGSAATNRIIGAVDTGGFPFTGTGVDKVVQVNALGLLRIL